MGKDKSEGGFYAGPREAEPPSDTLMVRQLGDLEEAQLKKALQAYCPHIKAVRVCVDRSTRKSKGFGFVTLYSIADAQSAMSRIQQAECMLAGKQVSLTFARPLDRDEAGFQMPDEKKKAEK